MAPAAGGRAALRGPRGPRARRARSSPGRPGTRVKMALFDLVGRLSDVPVWRLLGATTAGPVRCNATLTAGDPEAVAENAREWAARGFETFKLKVGMDGDVEQVLRGQGGGRPAGADPRGCERQLVGGHRGRAPAGDGAAGAGRAAGRDAGGDGRAAARAPTCCWQPTRASSPRRTRRPRPRVCDAATVKLAKVGGPRAAMRIAERIPVYLSSALDGPVGIAAAGARGAGDRRQRVRPRPRHVPPVRRHGRLARVRASTDGQPPPPRRPGPRSGDRRGRAREQAHRARLASRPQWTPPTATRPLPRRWSRSSPGPASRTRCVSPGSRSAPLARALWQEPGDPGVDARRRALRRLLRARHRAADRCPGGGADDLGDGRREPPSSGRGSRPRHGSR